MSVTTNPSLTITPITVTEADLPVYCPGPDASLWNMHPRVYIEIEKEGVASCPYCSASYQLEKSTAPE